MPEFLDAFAILSGPGTMLAILIGTVIGIIFGSIPGLTFSMALALVLPLTFALEPASAFGMLIGTYIGGMSGGSVAAVLVGIPGTPSTAATVLDGYPMALAGKASLALGTIVATSAFGGLFSLLVMIVSVDLVARMAIKFGPVEIFALVLFGMSTICGLAEKSMLRGMIAGVIGLMLMTIGLDEIDSVPRMTFGWPPLLQGVNLLVAMVGLFAVPQVMRTLIDHRADRTVRIDSSGVQSRWPSFALLRENFGLMMRCAGLGTVIGAVPGTGGPIAAFIAYDHARRFARDKSKFGRGDIRGVIAPETANNAVTGGAMIPLMSLGIPGDPATAVMLGGFLIHGLVPGPLLFQQHQTEVYIIYMAILVANLMVVGLQFYGIRLFVQLLRVPPQLMAVLILVMCVVGTFAIRNSFLDIYIMIVVGLFGYVLMRVRIPVTPIVLGLVLGPIMEREFRTAMIMSEGNFGVLFSSMPAVILYVMTIGIVVFHFISQSRQNRGRPEEREA